ncbi:MAG TPA: FIST N-terminal domain-containing protein [Gemmatimonadaceae bacterium]|nr:FIST N-terminal domain-containing protein [Gemmatimonadaceae bacterium]
MTDIAIASTALRNEAAGEHLATQISEKFNGESPDALLVFASPGNAYEALLTALADGCHPKAMIGCSSAGEFTTETSGTGLTSAIAVRAPDMKFSASLARRISNDRADAAAQLVNGFSGLASAEFRFRTAIILVDALAGHTEDLIEELTVATGGMYQFVGGGAGDNADFKSTHVFMGSDAHSNAAVALEILSNKPIGIGARHGWSPAGDPLRVTEADQSCVVSLNVSPAAEAFEAHAATTHQSFDRTDPMPFFLHNIVGMKSDDGHKLRVPLGVSTEGGVTFAAEVPAGATAQIMSTQVASASAAAAEAVRDAVKQVEDSGNKPSGAIFFDCVATRLRLGDDFGDELDTVARELEAPFAGFNSYGQIVRADGQFSGFHNCTAVVCVFPD